MALVTGAASGIGAASAAAFARNGAHVIAADIVDPGDSAIDHQSVIPARCDVAKPEDVEGLIASCIDRFGRLDYVHNNAATHTVRARVHELSIAQWDTMMDVNLRGAWLVLKTALVLMRQLGGGAIVNTTSIRATVAAPDIGAYAVTKAGLTMLTRVAALENADRGIRVNAVAPGQIATPRTEASQTDSAPDGPEPMRRRGLPSEVAEAVVWLCSDQASYVNGTCLIVDGGWTVAGPPRRAISQLPG